MKVALVHDWLNQYGGAELVLEALHDLFPEAPVFTSMYWPKAMPAAYAKWDIRVSFLDRLPLVKTHHQPFLGLYPLAFELHDLSDYDLVLSNSSAFCHGVLTRPDAVHINYCLTPPRFVWNFPQYAARERLGRLSRLVLPPLVSYLRTWDAVASNRVDHFIGISKAVVRRIRKWYRREAALIYPPVEVGRYRPATPDEVEDYYLIVSRLIPYKRVDLAVRAFSELGRPLVVVGGGRDLPALQKLAGPNVRFTGRVPAEDLVGLFARCRAFVFPGEEDFGIAPLEAQASGRPVLAYAGGGALETVIEGETGAFFAEPTWESLAAAVERFDPDALDPAAIRRHAERFDRAVFTHQLCAFIDEVTRHMGAASPLPEGEG
jgi:glycosyltransferase involved in cell wall biosynthesis